MQVQRINFPKVLKENEVTYLRYLEGILEAVDPDLSMILNRDRNRIVTRISPSVPASFNSILDEVKKLHTMLGIRVEFSKSMKAGANIHFTINFQENP